MRFSDADGELAVRIAREAIEAYVTGRAAHPVDTPGTFEAKVGAFVTLNVHPSGELRGCIGYPEPFFPLLKSVVKGAEGATEDPRFPRLTSEELTGVTVEVSLLTPPALVEAKRPKDLPKLVRVGEDGLKIAQGPYRGIVLPQVPVEWDWDAETFLSEACMKAGLLPDAWLDPTTRVYTFQAEIFSEAEPRGPVVRRSLGRVHVRR
ncbi:MAG: TIGR00296 family protein [Methanobacteriota archaeon]